MRVAVTGAAGFLGGAVARAHVAAGDEVVTLARRDPRVDGAEYRKGDLHDHGYIHSALRRVDVVQHIAARVRPIGRVDEFRSDNVDLTMAVFRAAVAAGARGFVHCSSPSVVFAGAPIRGADETLPRAPLAASPYSVTKAEAEAELHAAVRGGIDLPVVILRPHLIWGPGDRHLLPGLLRSARLGVLPRPTGPDAIVDPIYVADAARAHLLSARSFDDLASLPIRTYGVSGPERVSLWDAATGLIEAATGTRPRTLRVPRPALWTLGLGGEVLSWALRHRIEIPLSRFTVASLLHDQWFDTSAAERELGFRPEVGLAAGLREIHRTAGLPTGPDQRRRHRAGPGAGREGCDVAAS
jgi:2-alkyl-3-oxoalkanoate reductase